MKNDQVSAHAFLYYESTSKYVLDTISQIHNGPLYLSLVDGNCSNDAIITYARSNFDITYIVYVENCGTDQYGFFHSLKLDENNTPWIFYCHDKHPSKQDWLNDLLSIYHNFDENLLSDPNTGMISSLKHKHKTSNYEELLEIGKKCHYQFRKEIVQSMHTLIWLNELTRILVEKDNLYKKESKYPYFSSGNIYLIRRDIALKAHECLYDQFFNRNAYRTDGDIGHGLERFYFYVSECLGYNNIFI